MPQKNQVIPPKRPSRSRRPRKPPYTLPDLPNPRLIPQHLTRRDLWKAYEYLRIEALLRSNTVWKLYRRACRRTRGEMPKPRVALEFIAWQHVNRRGASSATIRHLLNDTSLRDQYRIAHGWSILTGSHHHYLKINNFIPDRFEKALKNFELVNGVVDLCAFSRSRHFKVLQRYEPTTLISHLREKRPDALYVRIDCTISPSLILRALRPILEKRHAPQLPRVNEHTYDNETGETTVRYLPSKDPPITNPRAWIIYFQCYDLYCSGKSFPEIVREVYQPVQGSSHKGLDASPAQRRRDLDRVKKAVRRIKDFIGLQEHQNWPSPKALLR